jgi:hypothetical protein
MNEKIIDTLRKLINHERSAREIGNVEEAAAFAAKIQSFIDKYNIELSEIDLTVEQSDVRSETLVADCKQQWMKFLLVNIAEINGCSILFRKAGYDVFGLPMDIELVATLYEYFCTLGLHLQGLGIMSYKLSPEYRRKRKRTRATLSFKDSFGLGYMDALTRRLRKQREESYTGSQAMIYIGNKLAKSTAAASNLPGIRTTQTRVKGARVRNPAFGLGIAAGRAVALSPNAIDGKGEKQIAS